MLKRKLEQESLNRPVSAFAVSRAAKQSVNIAAHAHNRPSNPHKKQKTRREPKRLSKPRPSGYWAGQNVPNTLLAQTNVQPFDASVISDTCSISDEDELDDHYSSSEFEVPLLGASPALQFSTFTPTKDNVLEDTPEEWTIRLNYEDTLTLVGQYDLWIRAGAVSILGAVLQASSKIHRVYAPSTHSLPFIRPIRDPFGPENQYVLITITTCTTRIRMLRELSPKFARIWNHKHVPSEQSKNSIDLSSRTFLFLKVSTDDRHRRPLNLLEVPSDWRTFIQEITSTGLEKQQAVMICGPKGSGKSTFCRLLTNSILTSTAAASLSYSSKEKDGVAFLDLDPGQPEYSPPGEISLVHLRSCNLGVPFTHPVVISTEGNTLVRAHHIGVITLNDPGHYQRCALNLLYHYKRILSSYPLCPLIVNCSGWVQGSGLEVLVELIRRWNFTHIVHITQPGAPEVVETLADSARIADIPFHILVAQPSELITRTGADLRSMQTLSYFHLDEPEGGHIRWNSTLINDMAPITARYAGSGQDIFAIIILGEEQDPCFLAGILEGSVVGLVAVEDDIAINEENYSQSNQVNTEWELDAEENHEGEVENNEQAQWISPHIHQDRTSSDSESDRDSTTSYSSTFEPHAPRRERGTRRSKNTNTRQANRNVNHPLVSRTPEGLPYLTSRTGTNHPLDPFKSHSIGQALIRGINTSTQTIHLLTPIPSSTFQSLQERNTKIVLVRGKLDIPTWAYSEKYFAAMAHRRRGRKGGVQGECESKFGADEMRAWAQGTPWAQVVDGKDPRGRGAKVWRVRRNLLVRPMAGGNE